MRGSHHGGEEEWERLLCAESQMMMAGVGELIRSPWQAFPVPTANM